MTMSICEGEGERGGERGREGERRGWERERGREKGGGRGRGGEGEGRERQRGGTRDRVCIYGNPPTTRNVQHTSEHKYIHVIDQIIRFSICTIIYNIIHNVSYMHTNDINF